MANGLSRREAAEQLLNIYNAYEARKVSLATIYRKMYRLQNGNWHVIGHAHDYTV